MTVFSHVLVTGGAGFIGGHLVDRLVEADVNVVVLDNLSSGSLKNVQDHIEDSSVRFVNGDVRDFEVLKRLVADVDCVIHFAAVTSVPFSVKEPALTHEVNVTGTLNLLEACLGSGVERFVFGSSCAVYGEPHYLPIDERHPVSPVSPYAVSKLAAENYCRVFNETYGLKTVVLRFFNVFGSGQGLNGEGGVISGFMKRLRCGLPLIIYGDGEQTRDFVHVEDVVDAVLLVLKNGNAVGETFNIGSGRRTSVNVLTKSVMGLAAANLDVTYEEPRLGDVRHSFANIEKTREKLGYEPRISLSEGLRSLLQENHQKLGENFG